MQTGTERTRLSSVPRRMPPAGCMVHGPADLAPETSMANSNQTPTKLQLNLLVLNQNPSAHLPLPIHRPNPLVRSSSGDSWRSGGHDLEAQHEQLPELRSSPTQQHLGQLDVAASVADEPQSPTSPGSSSSLAAPVQMPSLWDPGQTGQPHSCGTSPEADLLADTATQPPGPSSLAIPGAIPDPPALSAEGMHRRRTYTGEQQGILARGVGQAAGNASVGALVFSQVEAPHT